MINVLAKPEVARRESKVGDYRTKINSSTHTQKNMEKVIPYDKLSQNEQDGIVRLYNALVPENISKEIDIKMIVEEAFPAFERTIGTAEFTKVKKYFGIEGKSKSNARESEVLRLVGKMRTIENATKYISGYKKLIEDVAARLNGAPVEMENIAKAKFVRVFFIVFGEYHFFPEDFYILEHTNGEIEKVVSKIAVMENNKKILAPEELFFMYEHKIKFFKENSLMYGFMAEELLRIDKRLRKEVIEIAELEITGKEKFVSVNKSSLKPTFGSVRNLKKKVTPVIGWYPIEIFISNEAVLKWNFGELYKLYKTLEINDWSNFSKITEDVDEIEGSRILSRKRELYLVNDDIFSSFDEMSRFERYFWYLVETEYAIPTQYLDDEDGSIKVIMKNAGAFMAAEKFATEMEYISKETDIARDFEVTDHLLEKAGEEAWLEVKRESISVEEIKERFKIDSTFEKEVLNFKKKETPEEVAIRFAKESGYCESPDKELIENVLLPGNETTFEKYSAEEISIETLKKRIGFDDRFGKMYFDYKNVDMSAIEERLMEIKRSFSGKQEVKSNTLLINLYCYLVEGQIPCGAKMKAPKRNKGLKPAILRSLVE